MVNVDGLDRDRIDTYLSADAVPMVVFLLCQFRGLAVWAPDGLFFFPYGCYFPTEKKEKNRIGGKVEK